MIMLLAGDNILMHLTHGFYSHCRQKDLAKKALYGDKAYIF